MNGWVAYALDTEDYLIIASAAVVVIDGDTGRVRYPGSANDEG